MFLFVYLFAQSDGKVRLGRVGWGTFVCLTR